MDMTAIIESVTKQVLGTAGTAVAAGASAPVAVNTYIDHTVLAADTPLTKIDQFCKEAVEYKFASVCFNPTHVKYAAEKLRGTGVNVCTVIGFPLGANTSFVKAMETIDAIANGAQEIDMVANIGAIKDANWDLVLKDIEAVVYAARGTVVKVIIETCLLTDEEKEKMCDIVVEAGADFIKTSTGFSTAGATFHDIELFARCVRGRCKIKAAGGISTVEDMEKFLDLGADRLGTSRAVKLLTAE